MSVRVWNEVLERSEAALSSRLVLLVIADNAHDDGIAWPSQALIARKAGPVSKPMGEKTVRDAIQQLQEIGELEVRKARRGRSFVNVYRVTVGRISKYAVEYSRLPFELIEPFSQPADSAGSTEGFTRQISPGEKSSQPADFGRSTGGSDHVQPADFTGPSLASTSEPSEEPKTEPAAAAQEDLADRLALEALRGELEELNAGTELRHEALAAPERALAWIQIAKSEARHNPPGFVYAGLKTGEWPAVRGRLPGPTEYDRCRAWIEQTGCRFDPEDAHAHVDEWDDLGEVERQELHKLLDQAIAAKQTPAAEAAA